MKDTIITAKRKKTEIITFGVCFILANLLNLYSIITYRTSFGELFTSLGYVLVATVIIYIVWCILRFLFYSIRHLSSGRKK
ncbi:MAG: hypothetical protein LUG18_00160 [Candidatus Azobacteroides sp.]|nr:hypothetical protein [Candidatus Azobacteroides sp.]